MVDPLVSILIPNYNKGLYIRNTLNSILTQTYQNWECIIVDDHSTDASWDILKEYSVKDSRFKVFKRPNHLLKGGNAARNYAFQLSRGEYVNWFDSDDIMLSDFISTKVSYFEENRNFDCVICKCICFDENGEYFENWIPDFDNIKIDYLIKDIHFVTHGPMFRRDFLNRKELFNEEITVGQEKEFHFRLITQGIIFHVLDLPSFKYRVSNDSIVSNHAKDKIIYKNLLYRYFIARTIVFYCNNIGVYRSYILIPLKSFIYSCVVNFKLIYALKASLILSLFYFRSLKF